MMRWSQLMEKECIDLENGSKLGTLHRADLHFDQETGKILTLFIPKRNSLFGKKESDIEISWQAIRKVGPEMIILDSKIK